MSTPAVSGTGAAPRPPVPGSPTAPSPTGGPPSAPAGTPTPPAGSSAATASVPRPNVVVGQQLKPGKRRARLVVRRLDPWSVMKFSLLFSLCLLVVFVVAVGALYFALDALGVFDSVNKALLDLTQSGTGEDATGGVEIEISARTVLTAAAVVGAVNVVIITAICTLGAFLYNLCSDIVGGVEVTLAERE